MCYSYLQSSPATLIYLLDLTFFIVFFICLPPCRHFILTTNSLALVLWTDLDECTEKDSSGNSYHNCSKLPNSHCLDQVGSFLCPCDDGFMRVDDDGGPSCASKSCFPHNKTKNTLNELAGYALRVNSSVCVICLKRRIIILIIMIMGEIFCHILQTHHTHTHACTHARACPCTHTRTHTPPFRLSLFAGSMAPNHDGVNAPFCRFRW